MLINTTENACKLKKIFCKIVRPVLNRQLLILFAGRVPGWPHENPLENEIPWTNCVCVNPKSWGFRSAVLVESNSGPK
jgi:hypothetical protein